MSHITPSSAPFADKLKSPFIVVAVVRRLLNLSPLIPSHMASFVKRALTLPPTTRVLPSGVPSASYVNLAARAPASSHGHGHGSSGPRTDVPAKWAGGLSQSTSAGLLSKSYATSMCLSLHIFYSSSIYA